MRPLLSHKAATDPRHSTILSLQAGRSLISSWQEAQKGKRLADGVKYLGSSTLRKAKCTGNVGDLDTLDKAWGCVAAGVVAKAGQAYTKFADAGKGHDEALELCSQERFVAAKLHTIGSIFRQFRQALADLAADDKEKPGKNVLPTLERIAELYGLWQVEENASFFLKYGFYSADQLDAVSDRVTELCAELRKSVIVPLSVCRLLTGPQGRRPADRLVQLLRPHHQLTAGHLLGRLLRRLL